MNLGLLQDKKIITDWRYREFSPLSGMITNPDLWTKYLPIVEYQIQNGVETWSCVSYSALNCLEVLYRIKTERELNFNDQYIAILSGTTARGNYFKNVWQAIREYGVIPQNRLEFKGNDFDDWIDREQITAEMINEGKRFLDEWNVYYEWVNENDKDAIFQALGSAPLQVSVRYENYDGENLLNPDGKANHSVMLFNAEYGKWWEIYDHYTRVVKRYAWDYKFAAVLKPSLIKKDNNMTKFKNNSLLQLVEGSGGFGLYVDDKLYVDDLDKITASFITRNSGDIKGKAIGVTLDDWSKLEKFNLKGEKL